MSDLEMMTLSRAAADFIDDDYLAGLLKQSCPEKSRVRKIIAKSLAKQPLGVEETAVLLAAAELELVEEIFDAARTLKDNVYGRRVVLFAPLYIGNECVNDCLYCAFKRSNKKALRRTLSREELASQVEVLEQNGHKRLILVFGEHPATVRISSLPVSARFILPRLAGGKSAG